MSDFSLISLCGESVKLSFLGELLQIPRGPPRSILICAAMPLLPLDSTR